MRKFSIYTEKNENLGEIVSGFFKSFTISDATGYWEGPDGKQVKEPTSIVMILTDTSRAGRVDALVQKIKELNKQKTVLLTDEIIGDTWVKFV